MQLRSLSKLKNSNKDYLIDYISHLHFSIRNYKKEIKDFWFRFNNEFRDNRGNKLLKG